MLAAPIEFVNVPYVDDVEVGIQKNVKFAAPRRAEFYNVTMVGGTVVNLNSIPVSNEWVEVWLNGWRVVNIDPMNPRYFINGNQVVFTDPTIGQVLVVVDLEPLPYYASSIIRVNNVQRDQHADISLFSEPVIMSQPENGYVRLTANRKSIAYVPNYKFVGTDTFLWTLLTQHGQLGQAKCAKVHVF
jgi:hypothetical protein